MEEEKKELTERARALAREALRAGGKELLRRVEEALAQEAASLRRGSGRVEPDVDPAEVHRERYSEIIGDAPAMLRVFALLDKVAPSSVPVLIQGESGTGKELVARATHRNSPNPIRRPSDLAARQNRQDRDQQKTQGFVNGH